MQRGDGPQDVVPPHNEELVSVLQAVLLGDDRQLSDSGVRKAPDTAIKVLLHQQVKRNVQRAFVPTRPLLILPPGVV